MFKSIFDNQRLYYQSGQSKPLELKLEPTLVDESSLDSLLMQGEIFGPIQIRLTSTTITGLAVICLRSKNACRSRRSKMPLLTECSPDAYSTSSSLTPHLWQKPMLSMAFAPHLWQKRQAWLASAGGTAMIGL